MTSAFISVNCASVTADDEQRFTGGHRMDG